MSYNVLPIDAEMNNGSLLWGDIPCSVTNGAIPEEPPMAGPAKKVFTFGDLAEMSNIFANMPAEDLVTICQQAMGALQMRNIQAIPVAIAPLPAEAAPNAGHEPVLSAPVKSEKPSRPASFAAAVGDEQAVAAARPVVSASVKAEKQECPWGAHCKFGKKCRQGGHSENTPVEVTLYVETTTTTTTTDEDGFTSKQVNKVTTPVVVLMDKHAEHCRHDGGGKHCYHPNCKFAHIVNKDGSRVYKGK